MNKKGLCPINCRLTLSKSKKHFAIGIFINPRHWHSKKQLIEPPEPDADLLNSRLSLIKTKLNQAFLFLQVKGSDFTVDEIFKQYKGVKPKKEFGV